MYELTWITSQLASGYAPMSYEELDSIRTQGIDVIINLCGEFSDLHQIEEKAGFEVLHLAIADESVPTMLELEEALAWLDEAIYLHKKVLVHCRHGHGRTGTFISAYLVRRGHGLKNAEKILKNTRANPTNYSQWKLLRKFNKQEGILTASTPQLEVQRSDDLTPFLLEYEAIQHELIAEVAEVPPLAACGEDNDECCMEYFQLQLAESIWLQAIMNRRLSADLRQEVMTKGVENAAVIKTVQLLHLHHEKLATESFSTLFQLTRTLCPLSFAGKCAIFEHRPFRCRWHGSGLSGQRRSEFSDMLKQLSQNIFLALTGSFQAQDTLEFSLADTVSGRFIEVCFKAMAEGRR
ncbi:MAG: dual specificity protein phosphatase family protein [Desulfobulbaceae bacterium]|jgi:hypothetical protein|nr:dual specificity protein phosphatase family protein [Desulfobulbaceae bacterium]